jgi:site-specific recombinase XerC
VQDGVSLQEVQKLLGHSSSKVTEIYSHLQPEQLLSVRSTDAEKASHIATWSEPEALIEAVLHFR